MPEGKPAGNYPPHMRLVFTRGSEGAGMSACLGFRPQNGIMPAYTILLTNPLPLEALPIAEAHCLRTIPTPAADPSVPDGVQILRGKGMTAMEAYTNRINSSGAQPAPWGRYAFFEVVLTLSPGHEDEPSREEFNKRNLDFLDETFGEENVFWAATHNEERTRHMHAFVSPIALAHRPGRPRKGVKREKKAVVSWNRFSGSDRRRGRKPTNNVVLAGWQSSFARIWRDLGYRRGIPGRRDHLLISWIRGKTAAIQAQAKLAEEEFYRELNGLQPTPREAVLLASKETQLEALRSMAARLGERFKALVAPLQENAARGVQLEDEKKARETLGDELEVLRPELATLRGENGKQHVVLMKLEAENQALRQRIGAMAASQAMQHQEAHERLATIGDAEFEAELKQLRLDRKTVAEERAREKQLAAKPLSIPTPAPTLGHHHEPNGR